MSDLNQLDAVDLPDLDLEIDLLLDLLLLVVDLPFGFVNVLAALLYALAMPFVAITTTNVFFDSLARERLHEKAPAELPAEVSL